MTRLTDTDRAILKRYPASIRTALRHADAVDARVMRELTEPRRTIPVEVFEGIAGDLPDGAFFAMAEEFGIEPGDLA